MNKKILGTLLLIIATIIWGSSYIVSKSAVDSLTPALILFIRFILAALLLTILFYKRVKNFPAKKRKGSLITGCFLFTSYYVQTCGLQYTTPGKNAFLATIFCAIIPFLVWLVDKKKPDVYNFMAAFICIIGTGCVSLNGDFSINIGDLLTIASGFLYAMHILMIKRFSRHIDAIGFTVYQFLGASVIALMIVLMFEDVTILQQVNTAMVLQLFYLALFATAIALVCQTVGQKYTSECKASVILSLESVFGVIFSVVFYGEVLSLKVVIGFVLIFIAVIISETKLSFLKRNEHI